MIKKYRASSGGGAGGNSFETWQPDSGTSIVADSSTDTGTLTGGEMIDTSGDSATDTLTISLKSFRKAMLIRDEWVSGNVAGSNSWVLSAAGGTASGAIGSRPGGIILSTSTSSTGNASLQGNTGTNNFYIPSALCSFETLARLPNTSDGTDNFVCRFGLNDGNTVDPNNGIYFEYNHALNSGNWTLTCASGGVRTQRDTGIAVDTANFQSFKWVMAADRSSVQAYIAASGADYSAVGDAITTNIPALSTAVQFRWQIRKTAGTNAKTFEVDAMSFYALFSSLR